MSEASIRAATGGELCGYCDASAVQCTSVGVSAWMWPCTPQQIRGDQIPAELADCRSRKQRRPSPARQSGSCSEARVVFGRIAFHVTRARAEHLRLTKTSLRAVRAFAAPR